MNIFKEINNLCIFIDALIADANLPEDTKTYEPTSQESDTIESKLQLILNIYREIQTDKSKDYDYRWGGFYTDTYVNSNVNKAKADAAVRYLCSRYGFKIERELRPIDFIY